MNDCAHCPVETQCYYPYKPCSCVYQRKFWSRERREENDLPKKICLHLMTYVGEDNFQRCQTCDEIVD